MGQSAETIIQWDELSKRIMKRFYKGDTEYLKSITNWAPSDLGTNSSSLFHEKVKFPGIKILSSLMPWL